jgi:C-1 hydroxylase
MTSDQIAALIERHVAAWNRHDAAALCRDHAERGIVVSPMFSRVEGRAQICKSYDALFAAFPNWQIRFGTPIREGNRLAMPFSVSATHQGEFMGLEGTGRHCEFEGVSLYELDDDLLIREERRVYDFTGLLTKLGVLRVRPV